MTATPEQEARLFEMAKSTKEQAYAPYSHFRVGAAILCSDGTIFGGCNIENCAYPSGVCAERCAICNAIAHGHKDFVTIMVTSDLDDYCTPCGFCRQAIIEFGNLEVILTKCSGESKRLRMTDILPMAFSPADLSKNPNCQC